MLIAANLKPGNVNYTAGKSIGQDEKEGGSAVVKPAQWETLLCADPAKTESKDARYMCGLLGLSSHVLTKCVGRIKLVALKPSQLYSSL